jgi:hypothetical protein
MLRSCDVENAEVPDATAPRHPIRAVINLWYLKSRMSERLLETHDLES